MRTISAFDLRVCTPEATELPAPSSDVRYRLLVLSHNMADVVRSTGGWLFDRALAGCEVTVLLADRHDDRALRILGVRGAHLDDALTSQVCDAESDALAVSLDLYRQDPRVRETVLTTIDAGLTNVIMWGSNWPAELEGLVASAHHRLSIAARAFKTHALQAVAASSISVDSLETFRGTDVRTCRAACSHLITAS
jgi:hypothetical protein